MQKKEIKKKSGGVRVVYNPDPTLKQELRLLVPELNRSFLAVEKNNPNGIVAHGFLPGRSPVSNALPHVGKAWTLSMDLENFFDNINLSHVKGKIPQETLDKVLVEGSPRQGLPTSPSVSNFAAIPLDNAILKLIKKIDSDIVFSRYADDLSFSGNSLENINKLKSALPQLITRCGFKINPNKTRLQDARFGNREITGVMVTESGVKVSRKFKRKIRAAKHQKNFDAFKGMEEWAKLKVPGEKKEIKDDGQRKTYDLFADHFKFNKYKTWRLPARREDIIDGDFRITNDVAYLLGATSFSKGWNSCYRLCTGGNRKAPVLHAFFEGVSIAMITDPATLTINGVERNTMRARAYIYHLKNGGVRMGQLYSCDQANRTKLLDCLSKHYGKSLNVDKGEVMGYAPAIKANSVMYVASKVAVTLTRKGKKVKAIKFKI